MTEFFTPSPRYYTLIINTYLNFFLTYYFMFSYYIKFSELITIFFFIFDLNHYIFVNRVAISIAFVCRPLSYQHSSPSTYRAQLYSQDKKNRRKHFCSRKKSISFSYHTRRLHRYSLFQYVTYSVLIRYIYRT